MQRSLLTFINDHIIGSLKETNGIWSFQYSDTKASLDL